MFHLTWLIRLYSAKYHYVVFVSFSEKLFLTREIHDYRLISQAEVTIDGVNDKEEMQITDVICFIILQ